MKKIIVLVLVLLVGYLLFFNDVKAPADDIDTPEESITYKNASADLIEVESPLPNAVTGKDFSVIGKARGNYFFEASFPIDLLDKDGNILVQTYASAEGDWMTTDFVPFKSDIKIPTDYAGPATLVLKKDNPSDMRELDASISFPIIIE